MTLTIDNTEQSTGWSNVAVVNEIPDYVANDFSSSLVFGLTSAQSATKTYSAIDVSDYDELVFNIFITNQRKARFANLSDFVLFIDINGSEYRVPNYQTLAPVTIPLDGVTTINSIAIRHSLSGTQYVVLSGIFAVVDELPLDIYNGIVSRIRRQVQDLYGLGVRIGTATGAAGDTSISITGDNSFISRYTVVTITDGVNTEQHQLISGDDVTHRFGQFYDGPQLLNAYTDGEVWVNFPVEFGFVQEELAVPSIHIWGFAPTPVPFESKLEQRIEAVQGTTFWIKQTGQLLSYSIQLEVESRWYELMAMMTTAVRRFLGQEYIWINGRKFDFTYSTESTYTEPTDPNDIFPRVTYTIELEVREEIWTRPNRPQADPATLSVSLM